MFSPRELREAPKAIFDKHSFEWMKRGRADSRAQANRRRYPFFQFSWCLLNVLLVASVIPLVHGICWEISTERYLKGGCRCGRYALSWHGKHRLRITRVSLRKQLLRVGEALFSNPR